MNEIAVQLDPQILDQKRTSWGKMGEIVYSSELKLQAMAQSLMINFVLPTRIDEIIPSEEKLRELKSLQREVENSRKEITAKFDEVSQRLMQPEKSLLEPISKLSTSIISLKKEYERIQAIERNKDVERKSICEKIAILKANAEAGFKVKIQQAIDKAYHHALSNVLPRDISTFVNSCQDGLKNAHFTSPKPQLLVHYIGEELNSLIDKIWVFDSNYFVKLYASELAHRFSDYEVAFNNKAEALSLAQKQGIEKQASIDLEVKHKEVAAQLSSLASPLLTSSSAVKALKKSYEVDMEETVENAIAVMSAFTANLNICLPEVRVSKWFSFTPTQAAGALSRIKSKDNQFTPAGIIFKEVEKL